MNNPDFSAISLILDQSFSISKQSIFPPGGGGGAFGIVSNAGVYCIKDLYGRYTGELVNTISDRHGLNQIREIGGGLGVVAYFYNKIAVNKLPYTVYDLPAVSLMQAQFLMRSIGEDRVTLDGETSGCDGGIYLKPFWRVFDDAGARVLWINQDSMPEINSDLAEKYVRAISESENSFFLSINQEAQAPDGIGGRQLRVPGLTSREKRLDRQYRSRDFLRSGYIEELYSTGSR